MGNVGQTPACFSALVVSVCGLKISRSRFFFFQAEDGIRDGLSDWSSDVCSSDLAGRSLIGGGPQLGGRGNGLPIALGLIGSPQLLARLRLADGDRPRALSDQLDGHTGGEILAQLIQAPARA